MRVLLLGPYPPPHGGVQSNLTGIREFLRKRHVPVAVINLTRHRRTQGDDVYFPRSALQVFWLLLRLRCDIIHLHIGGHVWPRLLGLGLVCCLLPGRKVVLTFHSGGYPKSEAGQKAHATSPIGFIFRRFDRLIGVNPEIISFFHKLGVPPERTRLIYPHALSAEDLSEEPLPKPLREFFEAHDPILISVGLLEPEYDLPLQIEVAGLVRQRFPNSGLLMVGSGSLELELRQQIAAKPYAQHVLMCGDLARPATLGAIAQSDLMLRTTLYDGDAVSVREAMYLGTPVVATDNGMRPQGVRLIPPASLDALRQAIEETLATPPAQRRHVPPPPDERNLEAVFEVYRELVSE